MSEEINSIEVPVWTSGPGMRVNRDYLEPEHPESYYNYIKNKLGKIPEDYGYYCHTLTEEQQELLSTIPDEVLHRELRRRELNFINEEMYG